MENVVLHLDLSSAPGDDVRFLRSHDKSSDKTLCRGTGDCMPQALVELPQAPLPERQDVGGVVTLSDPRRSGTYERHPVAVHRDGGYVPTWVLPAAPHLQCLAPSADNIILSKVVIATSFILPLPPDYPRSITARSFTLPSSILSKNNPARSRQSHTMVRVSAVVADVIP